MAPAFALPQSDQKMSGGIFSPGAQGPGLSSEIASELRGNGWQPPGFVRTKQKEPINQPELVKRLSMLMVGLQHISPLRLPER